MWQVIVENFSRWSVSKHHRFESGHSSNWLVYNDDNGWPSAITFEMLEYDNVKHDDGMIDNGPNMYRRQPL